MRTKFDIYVFIDNKNHMTVIVQVISNIINRLNKFLLYCCDSWKKIVGVKGSNNNHSCCLYRKMFIEPNVIYELIRRTPQNER